MKSQMRYANRAWRKSTAALRWNINFPGGKKAWKTFCRQNAAITVDSNEQPFENQDEADESVDIELSYWDE